MAQDVIRLRPFEIDRVLVTLEGLPGSILVQHQWSAKAKEQLRQKHAGKKTKNRDIRDPQKEALEASYFTSKGARGIPAITIKASLINAAHKDVGIEKTLVRKAVYIPAEDPTGVLPFTSHSEPIMREDIVRVSNGQPDLRYRYAIDKWELDMTAELVVEYLQLEDFVNLINRAGFGVGLHEQRPEKGGDWGRFRVKDVSVQKGGKG